jgi:hypothetical protein
VAAVPSGLSLTPLRIKKKKSVYAGYEVLTAVLVKSSIFWIITPCNPLEINRCFGEIYCVRLQSRNQLEARSKLLHAGSLLDLFFDLEYGSKFLRNVA